MEPEERKTHVEKDLINAIDEALRSHIALIDSSLDAIARGIEWLSRDIRRLEKSLSGAKEDNNDVEHER